MAAAGLPPAQPPERDRRQEFMVIRPSRESTRRWTRHRAVTRATSHWPLNEHGWALNAFWLPGDREEGVRREQAKTCPRQPDPSPGSGVHATQSWFSHRCHHSLHRDGHLHLCRNGVLSEPCPHMASNFGRGRDSVVCAVPVIGDFTHYGRRMARGLCSHDDALSRVGDLRNALTLARDHKHPPKAQAPDRPLSVL